MEQQDSNNRIKRKKTGEEYAIEFFVRVFIALIIYRIMWFGYCYYQPIFNMPVLGFWQFAGFFLFLWASFKLIKW